MLSLEDPFVPVIKKNKWSIVALRRAPEYLAYSETSFLVVKGFKILTFVYHLQYLIRKGSFSCQTGCLTSGRDLGLSDLIQERL